MNDDRHDREPVRFLVVAGSLRTGSLNRKLAQLAVRVIEANGGTTDFTSMHDFDCPSYNQDVQKRDGFPEGAENFRRRIEESDAFVISSPEYNGTMPGVLKNAIDWVSRFKPQPFNEKHGLLLSASPSLVGGNRGLWSLRVPLEHLSARIYPDMFSLAKAHEAFDEEGGIASEPLSKRFEDTIVGFMDLVEAAKHYPCVKREWVEFVGEVMNDE